MAHDSADEKLQNTPPFRCNPDGIVRVWAYIGTDDPTRGASHGAVALARLVAKKLNTQMLYVDEAMLERSFPNTRPLSAQLEKLLAREGQPDILIGQTSEQLTLKTPATPTFLIDTIMTTMAINLYHDGIMAEVVPHHVTPDVLHKAGQAFQARHPELKHPLTAIFANTIDPTPASIGMLAESCLKTGGSYYFCPSTRRTARISYDSLTDTFAQLVNDDVYVAAIDDVRTGYNPYLGLLDQADHVIVLGESRSIVSEAVTHGRPVHVDWRSDRPECPTEQHYAALEQTGYVKYIYEQNSAAALDSTYLPPLNSTEAIADHIVQEFDRAARLRTLRPDMMGLQNPCMQPISTGQKPVI